MENVEKFGGFTPPVSNYFRMPNEWINICAEIKSLAELKVVQYVLRHTWGFQEYDGKSKPITTDEFMYGRKYKDGSRMDSGTGLSDRGVKDGVALAIEHGYLVCEVDDSDKARIKKSYGLKMFSEELDRKILPPKQLDRKNAPISDRKKLPAAVKNAPIDKEESTPRSEKETKEKHLEKEREKESVPSLPLSQKSSEEKTVPLEVDYPLFDRLCQEKGYAPDFKVPRNDKNATAIQELRSQGATVEQVTFVFNDIWNDTDQFWKQHRGKPSTVASQFTARVWKMTAPVAKRQTATGTTNWTEDRMGEPAQKAQPVISEQTAKPAQPKYGPKLDPTPAYTRAKFDEPARARSLQARLQAQKEV
jgi:hypothetical protein